MPQFSIHFDVDLQEMNQLFQDKFFNLVRQGILQLRPERPPFHVPPHVSMNPKKPANDGWQEISH